MKKLISYLDSPCSNSTTSGENFPETFHVFTSVIREKFYFLGTMREQGYKLI